MQRAVLHLASLRRFRMAHGGATGPLAARARWAALALVLLGCSAPDAGATEGAITQGSDDDADPAVVGLLFAGDATPLRCTGTLIDERVVLTAAHCGADVDPSVVEVFFGADLAAPGMRVSVLDAIAHPDYADSADHDLALLLLADPAPVDPIPLALDASVGAPPPVSVRLVGFGMTAAAAADADRKRQGASETTDVTTGYVVLGADPSLPCNGDSGGPVLLTTADGERLAAVVSRGDAACSTESKATRVDSNRAFIDAQLEAWRPGSVSLGARCLYDAHCESGVCAQASDEPSIRFCSAACASDADCGPSLICDGALCRYPLPTPGATGAACASDDECVRGECVRERGICSVRCVSGRGDCPSGFECAHLGGVDFFCLPEPPPSSCAVARAEHGSFPPIAVLIAALAIAIRRWR